MGTSPSPLQRLLVPAPESGIPDGFNRAREPLRLGLPHRLSLAPNLTLLVVAPVGLAATWRSVDPFASVTRSDEQLDAAHGSGPDVTAAAPARLLVSRGPASQRAQPVSLAQVPLTAGLRRRVTAAPGFPGRELELVVVGWDIRAGTLRGAGEFGSWLELAWRATPGAQEVFAGVYGTEAVAAA